MASCVSGMLLGVSYVREGTTMKAMFKRVVAQVLVGAALVAVMMSTVSAGVSAQAATNHCDEYWNRDPRYIDAIKAVATYTMRSFEELCTLPGLLDIEAQPDRVITRAGDVIPHVSVQLHREWDSCMYKVRDADKEITSAHCYSGF